MNTRLIKRRDLPRARVSSRGSATPETAWTRLQSATGAADRDG